MRQVRLFILVILFTLIASPAFADYDYEKGDERNRSGTDDCRDSQGTCEDNDFSPSFDKSPVDDSFIFQPTICMPYSICGEPNEEEN